MTTTSPSTPRRGLAITAVVLGAVACLMLLGYWLIAGATDGGGLTNGTLLAIVLYYASPVIGGIAVLLGVAAAILSRPRLFGIVGIILGAVPIIVVAMSFGVLNS